MFDQNVDEIKVECDVSVASEELTNGDGTERTFFDYNTTSILQQILNQTTETNRNVQILIKENKELKQRITNLEQQQNLKLPTGRLSEQTSVSNIKRDNRANSKSLLPKKPFDRIDDLQKFELALTTSEKSCEQLEHDIYNHNILEPGKFVRHIWKKIMTNEVACEYSWKGTATKGAVAKLTLTRVLQSKNI